METKNSKNPYEAHIKYLSFMDKIILKLLGKRIPAESAHKPDDESSFMEDTIHNPNWVEKHYLADPAFFRIRMWLSAGMFLSLASSNVISGVGFGFFFIAWLATLLGEVYINKKNQCAWKFRCLLLKDYIKMLGIKDVVDFNQVKKLDFFRMTKEESTKTMHDSINIRRAAEVKAAIEEWDNEHNKWKH